MTDQEAFDTAVGHLATMKRSERCFRYRNPYGGPPCAIGRLIPDDLYDPRFEGCLIFDLLRQCPALKTHFSGVSKPLLSALQALHDDHGYWAGDGFGSPDALKFMHHLCESFSLNPAAIPQGV